MRELILHHRYSAGLAWDTSGFHNHGVVHDVWPDQGAIRFKHPSSRIDVPPSSTLRDLGGFRCSVRFRLEGTNANARYNLAESQLSFALYIIPGFALKATILDGNGSWTGPQTGPLPINDGNWHRADCGHDGLSTGWLALDGKVVAVRSDVPGPVRPVGPNGLTVGHWPEPVNNYAFDGDISEVWLWRNRPDSPLDKCCMDDDALARAGAELRRLGYDRDKLRQLLTEIQGIVARLYTHLPAAARADVASTAPRLTAAFRAGDYALFAQYAMHLYDVLVAALGQQAVAAALGGVDDLLAPIAKDRRLREILPGLLCGVPDVPPRKHDHRRHGDPFGGEPAEGDYPGYPPANRPPGWSDPK
ncbi:MAG: hypothetical protein QOC82_2451 [Frankiaceae bacterium]|nr:hypothetical protein [Frankiaceae bacterium]